MDDAIADFHNNCLGLFLVFKDQIETGIVIVVRFNNNLWVFLFNAFHRSARRYTKRIGNAWINVCPSDDSILNHEACFGKFLEANVLATLLALIGSCFLSKGSFSVRQTLSKLHYAIGIPTEDWLGSESEGARKYQQRTGYKGSHRPRTLTWR